MAVIKVGFLISYDYEFIKTSLPRVYDEVEEIYFAVDVDGLTWAGEKFEIKQEFWDWVSEFDKSQKITIYRDHFYVSGLTPMQCDTRERNLLGKKMGKADWYIQIDSDEFFIDFSSFIGKLHQFKASAPVSIACRVATLFKKVATGYLLIGDSVETLDFATNNPVYDIARNNTSGNEQLSWDDLVLHQSWARTSDEIYLKLHNWGHKDDFNVDSFFKLWTAIDEFNYHVIRNFHPLWPVIWPRLRFIEGNVQEILNSEAVKILLEPEKEIVKRKSRLSRIWKEIRSK